MEATALPTRFLFVICQKLSLEKERPEVVSSLSLEELKHRVKTTSPGREESLWGAGGKRGGAGERQREAEGRR